MRRAAGLTLCALLLACMGGLGAGQDVREAIKAAESQPQQAEQTEARVLTGEELANAVRAAIRLQKAHKDVSTEPVEAQIIEIAPPAVLANGDGDVATTGDCQDDIVRYCAVVEPGEGRLAACLTAQEEQETMGNTEGKTLTDECKAALLAFKVDRATNINKDIPMARACKADAVRLCGAVTAQGEAAVLDCLRAQRRNLSGPCKELVLQEQVEEAKDMRVDVRLVNACADDAARICANEGRSGVEGAVYDCLVAGRAQVSDACAEQLERTEQDRAGDLRLARGLVQTCAIELVTFCAAVPLGEGRGTSCLEDHRLEDGFGADCRNALELVLERLSADYRLNYDLRESCREDIDALCSAERESVELSSGSGADSQVLTCLEKQRGRVRSARCRTAVHRQLVREGSDLRMDHALARACYEDRQHFCPNVQPGSARVLRCLEGVRPQLSAGCSAALFEHEARLADDIDFKFPLATACLVEADMLCPGVEPGGGRLLRCLQGHRGDDAMSAECLDQLRADEERSASDYRLHYRLSRACSADGPALCAPELAACGPSGCAGRVLRCLRTRLDEVSGDECRKEVLALVQLEVDDYRADYILAEACDYDVRQFCPRVKPGDGAVHACLRKNLGRLTEACRAEESKLQEVQARDVRLQPALMRACGEEAAVFCADVQPGQGRVLRCLQESVGQPGFGAECEKEIVHRLELAQSDYRLDYGVAANCKAEINGLCYEESAKLHGHNNVLKCLVAKFDTLGEACSSELSRAVRLALWAYAEGGALTGVCDHDVRNECDGGKVGRRGMWGIGAAASCLAKRLAKNKRLRDECKSLVLVAAPKDTRDLVPDGAAAASVAGSMARIARASTAGHAAATFVDPGRSGVAAVTLTGWAALGALAAVCAVVGTLLVLGVRRYRGADRQYTLVVKQAAPRTAAS